MEASCTDILVNSSLKTTKKLARAISENQVSDPGPSWPSCLLLLNADFSFEILFLTCIYIKSLFKFVIHDEETI